MGVQTWHYGSETISKLPTPRVGVQEYPYHTRDPRHAPRNDTLCDEPNS